MANSNTPNGLIPHGRVLRSRPYVAGSAIYPGDAVKLKSDGTVEVAAASNALLGAALNYAASGSEVNIADHPDQLFRVKADETEVDAQTDLNLNYNLVAGTASTLYKASRHALDSSTQATTATLPLKALAIDVRPDNALGTYADVIVCINNHQLKGGTGVVGV
jgi:hypothetical protein